MEKLEEDAFSFSRIIHRFHRCSPLFLGINGRFMLIAFETFAFFSLAFAFSMRRVAAILSLQPHPPCASTLPFFFRFFETRFCSTRFINQRLYVRNLHLFYGLLNVLTVDENVSLLKFVLFLLNLSVSRNSIILRSRCNKSLIFSCCIESVLRLPRTILELISSSNLHQLTRHVD